MIDSNGILFLARVFIVEEGTWYLEKEMIETERRIQGIIED